MLKIVCPQCKSDSIFDFITYEGEVCFRCDNCKYNFGIDEMELDYE